MCAYKYDCTIDNVSKNGPLPAKTEQAATLGYLPKYEAAAASWTRMTLWRRSAPFSCPGLRSKGCLQCCHAQVGLIWYLLALLTPCATQCTVCLLLPALHTHCLQLALSPKQFAIARCRSCSLCSRSSPSHIQQTTQLCRLPLRALALVGVSHLCLVPL